MQHNIKEFNPQLHECRKALTVKLPYAEYIAQGRKKIEVRSKNTRHRGSLIICSSQKPEIEGMEAGAMLAEVQLYDCIPLDEMTAEQWELTCIPAGERKGLKGYGWLLKNPIRIIEYPVTGQLGIWNLVMDKLEFIPYDLKKDLALPLKDKRAAPYNRKAVIIGGIIILAIFVLMFLLVSGVFSQLLA